MVRSEMKQPRKQSSIQSTFDSMKSLATLFLLQSHSNNFGFNGCSSAVGRAAYARPRAVVLEEGSRHAQHATAMGTSDETAEAAPLPLIAKHHTNGWLELRLNRPKKLNALSVELVDALTQQAARASAADVRGVLLTATPGRAFCAGGDIREVAGLPLAQGQEFLRKEYTLMLTLHKLNQEKPVIAVADGFVIGAGAGLFMAAETRVATTASSFSMPECVLGITPDVGATDFLSSEVMPGNIGRWMLLTGARLTAPLMAATGLATHSITSEEVDALCVRLMQCRDTSEVDAALAEEAAASASLANSARDELQMLEEVTSRVFSTDLEEIDKKLAAEEVAAQTANDDWRIAWAQEARAKLARGCPVALLVADECSRAVLGELNTRRSKALGMELEINQVLAGRADFQEGVSCAVGTKKGEAPQWEHGSVQAATADSKIEELLGLLRKAKPLSGNSA